MNQPPKSPDFNVLDLGYFNSIQSLQHKEQVTSMEGLITAVKNSFKRLPSTTLEDTFLTFVKVLECALDCDGGNRYRIPHVGKQKLRREDKLQTTCRCDKNIYLKALDTLALLKQEEIMKEKEIAQMWKQDKYYIPPKKRKRNTQEMNTT